MAENVNQEYRELTSTPTTPATGRQKFYPLNDGDWYILDDAAVERRLNTSGGGISLGFTTTATAAGTTTLTVASNPVQEFTGVTTQDCVLPAATTLVVGWTFVIRNASTGAVTVKTNGGATLVTLAANQEVTLYCKSIGTAAGTWSQEAVTGTGARVQATSPTLTTPAITGAVTLTGNADVIQFTVKGHSSQTANILAVQTSAGATVFTAGLSGAQMVVNDAGTNTIADAFISIHNTTGTPANGLGVALSLRAESSTTSGVTQARLRALWTDVTHASRKAGAVASAWDTAERDVIGWGADGANALLGFYATKSLAPIAQPTALTTQLTTITHTAPGTPDYAVQDLTQTTPFGFVTKDEGNTALSVIANLQTRVAELETKLQSLGLLA